MPFQEKRTKNIKKPGRRVARIAVPKRPGPPLRTLGPRPFVKSPTQSDSPGDAVPDGMTMTLAEWYVYWWSVHRRRLSPQIDFEFQSSLFGGRIDLGGLVIDFLYRGFFPPGLVVNVQGEAWHYYTTEQREANILTRVRLQDRGYTVVFVKEDDVLSQLDYVMTRAMKGEQLFADYV